MPDELNITRERLVQLLNEDLAREFQALIGCLVYSQIIKGAEYTEVARGLEKRAHDELVHAQKMIRQIDYLGGSPVVFPKPVVMSDDPVVLLHAGLENKRATLANYRQRIRQAEALGEFALGAVLRELIIQEQHHEIALASALGLPAPKDHPPKPRPYD